MDQFLVERGQALAHRPSSHKSFTINLRTPPVARAKLTHSSFSVWPKLRLQASLSNGPVHEIIRTEWGGVGRRRRSRKRACGFSAQMSKQEDGFSTLGWLLEPSCPAVLHNPDMKLANEDLRPTTIEERMFSLWDMVSLWVGLVVGIPSYYLAGSLVEMGMAWWQGVLTVMAGNFLLLFPLVLTGQPGTKYGIPFPVFARSSFGIRGAHVPTLLRSLVACGWFGIETWIGGQAILVLVNSLLVRAPPALTSFWSTLSPLTLEFGCFGLFWVLQVAVIWNGIESIRELEKYSAPILVALSAALLAWAYVKAGGLGAMLSAPSQFVAGGAKQGQFWQVFFPALTANIGFWATLSLNITDFTRYAKTQSDQILGHLGLPLFMGAFTFIGLAVTSATEVIFGHAISNPIELLGKIGGVLPTVLALVGITLATLTTNIAANVVAPANAFVNINPYLFSFRRGALLTAILGVLLQPWRLVQNSESFVNSWLLGYSALLGPLGGIVLADYYLVRNRYLNIDALYSSNPNGPYWYAAGFNVDAIIALGLGILPNLPGFLCTIGTLKEVPALFMTLYNNAWFTGFFLAGFLHWFFSLLRSLQKRKMAT